jgi:hypothetical protein
VGERNRGSSQLQEKEQIVAERIIRQLFDDLDQTEIPDGKGGSVEFALRGTTYTIDLTDANIAKLDKAFAPFVKAAVAAKESPRQTRRRELDGNRPSMGSGERSRRERARPNSCRSQRGVRRRPQAREVDACREVPLGDAPALTSGTCCQRQLSRTTRVNSIDAGRP